jgi:integrase
MRVLKDQPLHRAARIRLPQQHKPFWRSLEPGQALGYRKGPKGGMWLARLFLGHGRYAEGKLGPADDEPDTHGALDLSGATAKAREWCAARLKAIELDETPAPPPASYTVRHAVDDYLEDYKARGRGLRTVQAIINTHILPALGSVPVADLTTKRIRQWHHAIAAKPARLRTGRLAKKANHRPAPATPDEIRARRSTANGILNVLKAVLNFAYNEGKVTSDATWRKGKVKPFAGVEAPRIRYLSAEEAKRLVNACQGDFRQLVRAGLLTGCRYGEIAALTTSDLDLAAGTLLIRHSKAGKARHCVLTQEAKTFFETASAGKAGHELLFTRNGEPWKASEQSRPMRAACTAAKIAPAIGFHILRHTHGSLLAMAGTPLPVIAHQLGHADTRITEKHYAHLAPSYVADTIRANMPTLGIVDPSNVRPMKRQAKS